MKSRFSTIYVAALAAIAIIFSACATLTTGTTQLVTINCNVKDAIVRLDGKEVGRTPFMGHIKKNGKVITIEKEGYQIHKIALSTTMEGMFWGNIITGGTLGSLTDFGSGAAFKYSPASFQVDLVASNASLLEFKEVFELRKFAMQYMSNIAIDISNNNGDYLASIIYLAKLDKNSKAKELIKDGLLKSEGDQVKFGNYMVELLRHES